MQELRRHAPIGRARRLQPRQRPHDLPQLYATRKRRRLPDLYVADRAEARRGRFRWFFSTCLAAGVGTIAIAAVVLGSMDSPGLNVLPRVPEARTSPQHPSRSVIAPGPGESPKWAAPKSDRLQTVTGAVSRRFVVHEPINIERDGLKYMHRKPYARIVIRLGAVAPDARLELPQFNPQSFYGGSAESEGGDKDVSGTPGGQVTMRVVELLGSGLPTEDGQEMNGHDAAELLRRSQEAQAPEAGIRPTFVPEGAKISLPKTESRGRGQRAAEPAPAYTSVLEKTAAETEDAPGNDTEQPIASSLFASLYWGAFGQGITNETVQQVLRVHAHDTDFRRRAGINDTAEFFFDLKEDDKSTIGTPGDLLFTGMTIGRQTLRFFRFRTPDGIVDYYDEHGSNSRKFLMRQPVRTDDVRLTSGYGMRIHPLLNVRKLHTGVDWSAPPGSPIMAAGNGVVEEAQYKGQNGNFVRLRHANDYQTTYSHMSRFAGGITIGQKVRQGQIIGYVGITGLSTGPHLHFEVLIGDRYVDPVKIPMPESRRLAGRQLTDFQRERARIEDLMRRPPVRIIDAESK